MCEFCHKHGEGKKWYLQAKHYSDDLMNDLGRRDHMRRFFSRPEHLAKDQRNLEMLGRMPAFIQRAVSRYVSHRQKKIHYGQVVPIEDIERIFEFVTSITRIACICRHMTVGSEQRYCYGLSLIPGGGQLVQTIREVDADYLTGPDTRGLEEMGKDEALKAFRRHEAEGLCHTVWTFETPFIGGVCNCDQSDCLAMRTTFKGKVPVFFKAEYIARVNPDLCTGCRQCLKQCPFGAMDLSAAKKKVTVDERSCYGCGICRSVCQPKAINLLDRSAVPAAAALW